MEKKVKGICHLCDGEVEVTVFDPPKKATDEIGDYLLLDRYDCDSCGIEQEHKIRTTTGGAHHMRGK
jgi:hypothetical protein